MFPPYWLAVIVPLALMFPLAVIWLVSVIPPVTDSPSKLVDVTAAPIEDFPSDAIANLTSPSSLNTWNLWNAPSSSESKYTLTSWSDLMSKAWSVGPMKSPPACILPLAVMFVISLILPCE